MATHKKEVSLTDLQQKILKNDLYSDTDNAGLDAWIQDAVDGKINNCWKRFQRKGKTVALESANRNYETKIFGPDRVKVQGVLVSLYRNF